MLSKTEQEYLKNPSNFSASYGKVLKFRVAAKTHAFNAELNLLKYAGLVTSNCNQVTKFSNQNQGLKSISID